MSLLDDAKRLAEADPIVDRPAWGDAVDRCAFCDTPDHVPHDPDCPWLAMPKIIAVLEAAERLAEYPFCHQCGARRPEYEAIWCGICQVRIALIGEVVPRESEKAPT